MKKYLVLLLTLFVVSPAFASSILTNPKFYSDDGTGSPLSGGCLYTYACGTTTPLATCADYACIANNTNPITLDTRGEADVYGAVNGDVCYKLSLYEADETGVCPSSPATTLIWTTDNYYGAFSATTGWLLDEDDFASNSNTQGATQQSIKAYLEGGNTLTANITGNVTGNVTGDVTGDVTGGGTLTSVVLNTAVSGTAVDAAITASTTTIPTSNAVKDYVDAHGVIQVVTSSDAAAATNVGVMPYDDTIPQNTEGDEYLTVTITPTSATSTLIIDIIMNLSHTTAGNHMTVALFQDTTANALYTMSKLVQANDALSPMRGVHHMTAGTTSATTFKVRAGSDGGATTTFNGSSAGGRFGGTLYSRITVTEIK